MQAQGESSSQDSPIPPEELEKPPVSEMPVAPPPQNRKPPAPSCLLLLTPLTLELSSTRKSSTAHMSIAVPQQAAMSPQATSSFASEIVLTSGENGSGRVENRNDSSESSSAKSNALRATLREDVCWSILDDRLTRFSLVLNPILLLRLLLHKIMWDLGIVSKQSKPMAVSQKGSRGRMERSGNRAPSSPARSNAIVSLLCY